MEVAWPQLNHVDRYIRSAARVAIEHQDPLTWKERALAEKDPPSAIQALLALVPRRQYGPVPSQTDYASAPSPYPLPHGRGRGVG